MSNRLSVNDKLALIKRFKQGESASQLCREAGISRTIFYSWLNKYQQSSSRSKPLVFVPKVAKGKLHWKVISSGKEREVIKVALKYPQSSPETIGQLVGMSGHGVWNILKRNQLNTQQAREVYLKQYGPSLIKTLNPTDWQNIIRRYLEGEKIAYLCRENSISRTIFYKWLKRYQTAAREKKLASLASQRPMGKNHWRFIPQAQELVLEVVVKQPNFSSEKISQVLAEKLGKQIIGNHGVYNLLKRLNLNTLERRLAYVQSLAPITAPAPAIGWQERITKIIGSIPTVSAIPPPAVGGVSPSTSLRVKGVRERFSSLIKPLLASFLTTFVLSNLIFYWIRILSQSPTFGYQIGLVFATISLLVGGIFFIYSMKYYFTLALVLSFSRNPKENGHNGFTLSLNGKVNGNHNPDFAPLSGASTGKGNSSLIGWIAKLLGIRTPISADTKLANPSAGGLQPSLDHIHPTRYPFFSIHLPFYNEKKVAERIIRACLGMDYPGAYEVIVCDDSNDETVEIIRGLMKTFGPIRQYQTNEGDIVWQVDSAGKPTLKVLHRPTRSGFKGGALSHALNAIDPRTEFVCVFDADFIPYPDTLEQFLKYFKATNGWSEEKDYTADQIITVPYDTFNPAVSQNPDPSNLSSINHQLSAISSKSNVACVAGYQWHVLNKSENWITRGVRTEYAGSYVVERPGQEILGAMKIIHGSVYCIRADVLKHFGWGTSITEDYELTLRIYEQGFKVVFTPYIQAPSECVSTLKRLIRQRMRWAEGHSFNTRKMLGRLLLGHWAGKTEDRGLKTDIEDGRPKTAENPSSAISPQIQSSVFGHQSSSRQWIPSPLTLPEKLEFLYLAPYYLQAAFFILGTLSWLLSETVFKVRLPFWTALWGWSLVLTNFFSLPLVNAVGLFLEESEEKDYVGIASFILLCYLVTPFQAYAAVKGFVRKTEGPWFRTPKTGRVTDIFTRGSFYRWLTGLIPGKKTKLAPAFSTHQSTSQLLINRLPSPYLALATANNQFHGFRVRRRHWRGMVAVILVMLIISNSTLFMLLPSVSQQSVMAQGKIGMIPGDEISNEDKSDESGKTAVDSYSGIVLTDNRQTAISQETATTDLDQLVLPTTTPTPNPTMKVLEAPKEKEGVETWLAAEGKYRAVFNSQDGQDYLKIYGWEQNLSNDEPDYRINGPVYQKDNESYSLNDSKKTVSISEKNNSLIKVKVEGCLSPRGGNRCLAAETGVIGITEEFRFSLEGIEADSRVDLKGHSKESLEGDYHWLEITARQIFEASSPDSEGDQITFSIGNFTQAYLKAQSQPNLFWIKSEKNHFTLQDSILEQDNVSWQLSFIDTYRLQGNGQPESIHKNENQTNTTLTLGQQLTDQSLGKPATEASATATTSAELENRQEAVASLTERLKEVNSSLERQEKEAMAAATPTVSQITPAKDNHPVSVLIQKFNQQVSQSFAFIQKSVKHSFLSQWLDSLRTRFWPNLINIIHNWRFWKKPLISPVEAKIIGLDKQSGQYQQLTVKTAKGNQLVKLANQENLSFQASQNPHFQILKEELPIKGLAGFWQRFTTSLSKSDGQDSPAILQLKILDQTGQQVKTQVLQLASSSSEIEIDSQGLKPGKYKMEIFDSKSGQTMTQDFTWGVLAINTNKSIYTPGERVYLQMAALNEQGHTLCNAKLSLEIRNPKSEIRNYSVQDNTIVKSDSCGANNVTDNPDYYAYYAVDESTGTYTIKLINKDTGYFIEDQFEVRKSVPFEVERVGATRINPFLADYTMTIKIKANEEFRGEVRESIPNKFEVKNHELRIKNNKEYMIQDSLFMIQARDEQKELIWSVDWQAGEEYELIYEYQAPQESPQLYLLGPLKLMTEDGVLRADIEGRNKKTDKEINNSAFGLQNQSSEFSYQSSTIFRETRQWQIAADGYITPTIRAVGTYDAATGTIAPALPSGTVAGDLLIMFVENSGEAAQTASGWTQLDYQAITGSSLTILYKIAVGSDATTTNDVGDHQLGQIIGITTGTFDSSSPFGAATLVKGTEGSGTSKTIGGITTTVNNALVIGAIAGDLPDGNGTTNWADVGASGGWTNANLTSLTEQIDRNRSAGNGGSLGVVTGVKGSSGSTGNTTVTAESNRSTAHMMFAVKGKAHVISGTVYSTDESTALGSGIAVKLVNSADVATSYTADTDGSGNFSISVTGTISNSDILTLWLNDETPDGTLVLNYGASCTGSPNCTGLSIYQDRVIIRDENTESITNAMLATCDNDSGTACFDSEIGFTSESNTLTVSTGRELHIWTGDTHAPGGDVSTSKFHLMGVYTGATETLTLSGTGQTTSRPFYINGGTFTPTSDTVTFTGGSTSDLQNTTYYNLTINGTGPFNGMAATTVNNSLTVSSGTLAMGAYNLTVGHTDASDNGYIRINSGATISQSSSATTTIQNGSGGASCIGGTTDTSCTGPVGTIGFYNLTIGASSTTTINGTSPTVTVANVLTISSSATLRPNASTTITLSAAGTPITRTGTFDAATNAGSTVKYTSTSGVTQLSSAAMTTTNAFYNLEISSSGQNFTAGVAIDVLNDLKVAAGTLAMGANNLTVGHTDASDNGYIRVASSQTISQSSTATTTIQNGSGGASCIGGTTDTSCTGPVGTIGFYNLTIGNSSSTTINGTTPTVTVGNTLTIGTSAVFDANGTLNVAGNWANSGTFDPNSSTVNLNGGSGSTQTLTGSNNFYNLSATSTSSRTLTFTAGTTTTINAGGSLTLTSNSCANIMTVQNAGSTWNLTFADVLPTTSLNYLKVYNSNSNRSITVANGTNGGGNTNWTFSSNCGVTISGTVYSTNESTALGANLTVKLVNSAATSTSYNDDTDSSGNFEITGVSTPANSDILTLWLNDEGNDGTLVLNYGASCTGTPNCTGLSIFENRVIFRDENSETIENSMLTACDIDSGTECSDSEIGFSCPTFALTVSDLRELHIWDGDSYAPGGDVTTSSATDQTAADGDVHIDGTATWNSGGTIYCGGDWTNEGTFDPSTHIVEFNGTDSDPDFTITDGDENFDYLVFNGNGGEWEFSDSTTIDNNLTITAGTLHETGSDTMTINGGSLTCGVTCGTISMTGGTVTLAGTGDFGADGLSSTWTFNNLTFGDTTTDTTDTDGTGTITVSGTLTITSSQTLQAGAKTWKLAGTTTPMTITGTLTEETSTFNFAGNASVAVNADNYYNLEIGNDGSLGAARTYTPAVGTINVTNNLTVGAPSGSFTHVFEVNTNDNTIDIDGSLTITSLGTYSASSNTSNPLTIGNDFTKNGTFTHNEGKIIFDTTANTSTLVYGSATEFSRFECSTASKALQFEADYTTTIDSTGGTFTINGGSCNTKVSLNSDTGSSAFTIQTSGATVSVTYASIRYSTASTAMSATYSLDAGNNSGWAITEDSCATAPSGNAPKIVTTVDSTTITVRSSDYDNSGSTGFKLVFDSAKGGTIDEFYHDSIGAGSTNIVSGNSTYDALFDIEYGSAYLSGDTTGSLMMMETSPTRAVVRAAGNVTTTDIATITYTIYADGQMFLNLSLEIHDGERNSEDDMFFLIQDYSGYQATYYSVDDTNKAAALLPDTDGYDAALIPYDNNDVGTVDNASSEANDYIVVKYDSAAAGYDDETTVVNNWLIDLSESIYDSTLLSSKRTSLRNPDTLTYTTGTEWDEVSVGPASLSPMAATPGVLFDGAESPTPSHIKLPNDAFDSIDNGTIEYWFKAKDTGDDYQEIFTLGNVSTALVIETGIRTSTNQLFVWEVTGACGPDAYIDYVASIPGTFTDWHHVAIVVHPSGNSLYLDGTQVTPTYNGTSDASDRCFFDDLSSGTSYYTIGCGYYAGTSCYTPEMYEGMVDELRIWNTNRTQTQIRENMYKQIDSSSSNLVGYYRLGENTGTTTYDETSNSYDGTLYGTTAWTTGFIPDQYNETEGPYSVDAANSATYNVASRTNIDLDGGTYPRYKPPFKVRKWRDTRLPPAVTLEGTTLYPGTSEYASQNYNVSLKPFSEAWYDNDGSETQIADGGDFGATGEYLAEPLHDYTLTGFTDTDYLYLGSDAKFTGVNYYLSTQGAGGAVTWEYWDGDSWEDLSNVTDGVYLANDLLTTNGSFYFDEPYNWTAKTLGGTEGIASPERNLYWIRADVTTTFTTVPVIDRMWTDILLFQYYSNITSNSQTLIISSSPLEVAEGTIQIDVPNRYRAILNTGDTTDYMLIYDRAQSDSSPANTYEFIGPNIYESSAEYQLRYDAKRITTIIESNSLKAKIRVEGCFDTTGGSACLADGTNKLLVTEEYTFTTEGIYVANNTDFRASGVALDTPGSADENGYNFLMIDGDIQDNAFGGTLYYGDGNTEGNTAVDATFEETNTYATFPAVDASGYQSAIVTFSKGGWFDQSGGTEDWRIDVGYSGTIDRLHAREGNVTPTGLHYIKWNFLLQPENDMDAETEREAFNNDFRNPDTLTYTTGSEWDDASIGSGQNSANSYSPAPASTGLIFNGSNAYVDVGTGPTSVSSVEFWVYPETTTEYFINLTSTTDYIWVNGGTVTATGFASPTIYVNGTATTALVADQWQHVAVTDSTAENASNLDIGRTADANYLEGKIDEVRLWSDVRTAAEIQQNMYRQISLTEAGLVAYYRLNENSGTIAHDKTGNSEQGTITNAVWTTGFVPDQYNEAESYYTVDASGSQIQVDIDGIAIGEGSILFDDASSQYLATTTGSPVTAESFSMAAWFYNDDLTAADAIMSIGDKDNSDGFHTLQFAGNLGGDPVVAVSTLSGATAAQTTTGATINTWHHACGVWADTNDRRAYIDGSSKGTDTTSKSISGIDRAVIGATADSTPSVYFSGRIAEAAIWSTALTDAQCAQLADGAKPSEIQAANLVGYWPIYSTSDITDKAGDYDMTASGSPTTTNQHPFLAPRHKPSFKVRKYYQNNKPSSVTMEGTGLVEGTDYNTAYKPFTSSYFASKLTWASTLESETVAESPDIGSGDASGSSGTTYTTGKYGNGANFDGNDDYIYFPISSNIDFSGDSAGVIDFWAQPHWTSTTTTTTYSFLGVDSGTDWFEFFFHGSDIGGTGQLRFATGDGGVVQSRIEIDNANFSWNVNDWVHFRLVWDDTLDSSEELRVFINGVETSHSITNSGSMDVSVLTLGSNIYIGNSTSGGTDAFDGVIDEFRVYSDDGTPVTLAKGGDVADGSEYLFSEDRDYSLAFVADDDNNRGEYLFLGSDSMFQGVNVDLATLGSGSSPDLNWEYWNGSAWASLEAITGFADNTSQLTADGAVYWSANPTNWRPYSVNGSTDLYYIRVCLESGTLSTAPIENLIRTDIIYIQYLANITSSDQTLILIPENLWLVVVVGLIGVGWQRKRKRGTQSKTVNIIEF